MEAGAGAGPFNGLTLEALFRGPLTPHAYEYWYPALSYDPYAYAYAYPCPYVIYVHECRYWSLLVGSGVMRDRGVTPRLPPRAKGIAR
jgi:hypothetical protein